LWSRLKKNTEFPASSGKSASSQTAVLVAGVSYRRRRGIDRGGLIGEIDG